MDTPSHGDDGARGRKRWRYAAGALAAALVLAAAYVFAWEPGYHGAIATGTDEPLVFAHRGFGDHGPDNSLYAVERALEAGMAGVDVDGQLTRDGELVIFHDLSVDRLTSDTGRVANKSLDRMLSLDLGPGYDPTITGAYVRTFEDFVRTVKGRGTLMVELKVPGARATGIEERAVEVIQKHDAHGDVILSAFNPLVLRRIEGLDSRVRTAFIFMDTNWNPELVAEIKEGDLVNLPWFLRQEFIRRAIRKLVRPDMLSINHEVDESVLDRLIARGWPVFIWTPNDEEDIRRAASRRPYGIISDRPLRARELLEGHATPGRADPSARRQ